MMTSSTSSTSATMWNGPVCFKCGTRYLGSHACTAEDVQRQIDELTRLRDSLTLDRLATPNAMRACPCRPENGGSGVCGCILSGPRVTC